METSHQPTSRGLPRPIRGLLVNQAPAHKESDTLPLRFISPPQWQRGWFFDIATPHHVAHSTSRLPHRGLNARDLDICPRSIHFPETYRSNPENRRFQTHILTFNPTTPPQTPSKGARESPVLGHNLDRLLGVCRYEGRRASYFTDPRSEA